MPKQHPPMQLVIDDLSVLVSKKKVAPTLVLPKIVPVIEKENGDIVEIKKKRLYINRESSEPIEGGVTYRDTYWDDEKDEEIAEPLFAIAQPDGSYKRVSLFQKTSMMSPDQRSPYISLTELQNFIFDGGVYEVFISENKYKKSDFNRMLQATFTKAEEMLAAKKAMRFKYVHRDNSMRMYIAHLWPIIQRKADGSTRFVFLMGLSTTAMHYDNMMEVPSTATVKDEDIVDEPDVSIDAIIASSGRVKGVIESE